MVRLLQDKLRKYLDLNRALKDEKDAICLTTSKTCIQKEAATARCPRQLVKALKVAAAKQKSLAVVQGEGACKVGKICRAEACTRRGPAQTK